MQKQIFLVLLLFAQLPALAQREDLSSSMAFFEKKASEYQHWLEVKGFGEVLNVERVRIKIDRNSKTDTTELELFLLLTSVDADTAKAKWNRLKMDFDTDADSLEAYLFRTFIHQMEIPEDQGNIQIYVRNKDGIYIKDMHIWIWSENGLITRQQKMAVTKSKSFEVRITPYHLKSTGRGKAAKVRANKRIDSNVVFDLILKYITSSMLESPRYKKELADRKPHIENDSMRTATTLKFTVADMGKEVLTNQNRYFWESWVDINTIAMERLHFQFEYIPAADGGYALKCMIDGKFGSGVFKPRTSGYMNMEPDFDDFFEKYKDDFRQKLQNLLQQKI